MPESQLRREREIREVSPVESRFMHIEEALGGLPKKGQMVRYGHFPKFSEMIDKVEHMAVDFVGF